MSTEEAPQEVLNKLERQSNEASEAVVELKEKMRSLYEQLATAQEASYKAFKTLNDTRSAYLVNIIKSQETQLKAKEPREDNVKA